VEGIDVHVVQVPRRFVRSNWGGTETVILETSKRLLARGHQTHIVCPNALARGERENLEGVDICRVPYFYPYWGLQPDAIAQLDTIGGNMFSFALLRALRTVPDLDVIHLHTGNRIGGIGRYVAQRRDIPYVISLHGGVSDVPAEETQRLTAPTDGTIEWGKVLGWWVGSRRVLDDAAAILCVGQQEQRDTQRRFPDHNVVYLPNGVDPKRFARGDGGGFRHRYRIPSHAHVLLIVGRIDPQKNQELVIRLLPELLRIQPNVHIVCLGHVTHSAYRQALDAAIDACDGASRVTIIEGLDAGSQDLVDAYHAADLFVLPSVHEPFGIVILEAWAAGLPVLASRVGGVPAVVRDGYNGALFDPHETSSFLHAFDMLNRHPDTRRALALTGQQEARSRYDWDQLTSRLVTIYEEAIRAHPIR